MYALIMNNQVVDIEKREINLSEYYHIDLIPHFIECDDTVEIGDTYTDGVFSKSIIQEQSEVGL